MTRTHFLTPVSILPLLWLIFGALPASAQPVQTWATSRMTQSDTGNLVEFLWAKGNRMRSLTVIAGRPVITLVNATQYIIIDTLGKEGVSIGRSPIARKQDAKRPRPFGNEAADLIAAGAERVSGGVESGLDAVKYRLNGAAVKQEIWVTSGDYELPVEIYRYFRKTASEMRIRYLGWSPGLPMPDWFFEPAADVKLEVVTYDEYVARSQKEAVGPAPPFYAELLHGRRE